MKDARKAANFGISNSSMIDTGNNLLRDEGDGDGGLFKGIFMRYLCAVDYGTEFGPHI